MSATSTATVGDVMHEGVVTCDPETPLKAVAELMAEQRIHCVVVFTEATTAEAAGRHWGLVSDLDLVAAIDEIDTRTAREAANAPVVLVMPDKTLRFAAELMTQYRTAHLVVVDPGTTRPVGIISTLDVARAMAGSSSTG